MRMRSLEQLAKVLQDEVDQCGGLIMDHAPSWEVEHPRFRLHSPDSGDQWVDIELGYEMFFLDTSSGYYSVDSARDEEEKLQLISDLVAVSAAYLQGEYQLAPRTFGRRFNMVMEIPSGPYSLKPK